MKLKPLIFCLLLSAGMALPISVLAQAQASDTPLEGLLNEVERFSLADRELDKAREQHWDQDLQQQQQLLEQSRDRLQAAEAEQIRLKTLFDDNDTRLGELEALIQQRAGQLGEVFGVAKQEASELRPLLDDSLASADNPGRSSTLAFADSRRVPTLKELEALWYQLQLEMTASGQVSHFETQVIAADGAREDAAVIRFGLFAAATEQGEYLNWDVDQQQLVVLPTQPAHAQAQLSAYLNGSSNEVKIDPSRGQLFSLLDRLPKLSERIAQGAEVGYLIIVLGVAGLLIALWRLLVMIQLEMQVKEQLKQVDVFHGSNPLGRVLLAASDQNLTAEQRELKVDEAILQELPRFERGQSSIKLLAGVAPLLGLLGTVVGMIATFQSITLFGTSDPKLMAGGISQALITTALGLSVAIPLLFSHSFLAARSRRLGQILQEKSLGILAQVDAVAEKGEDRAA